VSGATYDRLGRGYSRVRRPDPRLGAAIWDALGEASTVLSVGAGAGSYEPTDRPVLAVEPSAVMLAQRPSGAAPAIQAVAESLPIANRAVDASLAVLTLHHWADPAAGIAELVRVTRRRIVLVTMDPAWLARFWLIRDYLPEALAAHAASFPSIRDLCRLLPGTAVRSLPVPRDCTDGFMAAYWGRPEAYLHPEVRAASSPWHQAPPPAAARVIGRLRADLASGS
jgi:SAM-dependent methyltransferase